MIGQGVLKFVAVKMLSKAGNDLNSILLVFVIGFGIISAFLVNDTIALLGIPLIVHISRQISIRPTVLFIALAFGISIGSVMTPIGNPQNLLIAIKSNIPLPFLTFLRWLFIPNYSKSIFNLLYFEGIFKRRVIKSSSQSSW